MKIKKILFNVIVYTLLGWSIVSAGYLALPPEYQEMLPNMNWLTAIVSGGSTGLLGTGGLYLISKLKSSDASTSEKITLVASEFINITNDYKSMKSEVSGVRKENLELKALIQENNELQKINLEAKLSNPFISEATAKAIEGVLNDK